LDEEVRYIVKVSKKGQIVPLEELFGADGQVMRQIAKEIVEERRKEIRREEEIPR